MLGGPVAGDGSSLFAAPSAAQEGSPGAPTISALDVILSSYRTMERAGPIESRTLPASIDNGDEEISHARSDSDRGQTADDLRVSRSLLEAGAPAVGYPRVWGFPTSVHDDQIPENCCVQGESRAACRRNMQAAR